jgi:YidC/Oxa1 family membrane protein insertase
MYDRKTWIVLVACGLLLALNIYYSSKTQQERQAWEAEQRRLATEATEAATAEAARLAAERGEEPPASPAGLTVDTPPPPTEEELVVLENDRVSYTLTTLGGGIKFAEFKNEFQVGSETVRVRANRWGQAAIGTLAGPGDALENIPYTYKAEDSEAGRSAVFIARHPSGLVARKTYSLADSSKAGGPYLLDFTLELQNAAPNAIDTGAWSVFLGEAAPLYQAEFAQQTGFFWREDGKIHFKDGGTFKGGWFSQAKSLYLTPADHEVQFAGVTNQFFATVLRPENAAPGILWARSQPVRLQAEAAPLISVRAGLRLPAGSLAPGAEPVTHNYRIFIGPKHNPMLRKMEAHWGQGWGDVMQYGWFWWVSRPLNWLLNTYHSLLDGVARKWSWGLAIIFLTITVRILIWPLHAKSTRTMKRMSKLKPEMDKLREKYPDDPNKLNTEMMGLYRKFGINPLGGCLPVFIQLPIFFGFYRMLQYAVELRHQGFLWVADLSQPDTLTHIAGIPINILPIVMAFTSFLQIKMTPTTGDKMQQRIILFMPLIFFFFCYNFASALALYWTTQNIFSIGQTWLMNKTPEPELKPRKDGGRKSWVQRMAEKQAELQKLQQQRAPRADGSMRNVTPPESKKKRPPRTGG